MQLVSWTWDREDFVAGGFWVDDLVGIGPEKELAALAKGIDAKYGVTGLGEVRWILGMIDNQLFLYIPESAIYKRPSDPCSWGDSEGLYETYATLCHECKDIEVEVRK